MQSDIENYFNDLPPVEAYASEKPSYSNLSLDKLNKTQREAVEKTEGPILVLAGAGTGKTSVLTTRIAYILSQSLAFPSQILAVTFTNKAAKEMKERISDMVGSQSEGLWLGTFHSISLRIIRKYGHLIGLDKDFTIIDASDQLRLIKQIEADEAIDPKQNNPKAILATIQGWKDKGLEAEKISDGSVASKIYSIYQRRMLKMNICDFGDLLLYSYKILVSNQDVLDEYHRKFKYILVDEYQDTNIIQYLWLRLLAQSNNNICCVGDDDQSIYGWRGAEIGNILKFEKDFPSAQVIRLECNYRSTRHILSAASNVISNNKERLGKTLYCDQDKNEEIEKINVVSLWDERMEADYIANQIQQRQKKDNVPMSEFAVLVRAGHQTRAFEECFIAKNLPYIIIGGMRFYERLEIKDAIAYIRLIVQPENDLAFQRVINTPKRGVGKAAIENLRKYSLENNISLVEAIDYVCEQNIIKGKAKKSLVMFKEQLATWRNLLSFMSHSKVIENVLDESGYMDMWKSEKTVESQGRIENLKELFSALEEFKSLDEFIEHISLISDGDVEKSDMVNVMTIHGSKGLEFDSVFLAGWEEGLFPSQRSVDESGAVGLEEERRLAYVSITRAKKKLTISFAANRFTFGQNVSSIPSRFIDELPKDSINIINSVDGNQIFSQSANPYYGKGVENKTKFSKGSEKKVSYNKSSKFNIGDNVFHHKFGKGHVRDVKGKHITVLFSEVGKKTLMEDFLQKS